MTNRKRMILVGTMMAFGFVVEAQAQFGNAMQDLQRVRQQFNQPPMNTYPINPITTPGSPNVGAPPTQLYPQFPVYVSPDQFNGINPWTGGINTKNEQIDNSYYDPFREASKNNGTRRWVQRPIYNSQGQVVGYQEGYVWTNSVTGVEHGELKNVTGNNQGGEHEQIQLRSVPN